MKLEYKRDNDNVLTYLYMFKDCFVHLMNKIDTLELYAKKLKEKSKVYIASINNEIVGFCCFYDNDNSTHIGYISLIAIKNNYRKYGYGSDLIDFIKNTMKKSGMYKVKLEVDNDNSVAINFYKKNGFLLDLKLQNSMILSCEI